MSDMSVIIDGFDFWNMAPQKYYAFTAAFKGDKKAKAKELVMSNKYIGSRKMDGAWNMIIKDMDGNFHMRSRTESVNGGYQDKAEWIPHICKELSSIPNGTVLIGEIYFPDNEGSRKITSVLNCLKDKCLERQKKNGYLHFYVFDVVAYNGKSLIDTPISERVNTYLYYELLDALKHNDYVEMAEYVKGKELWELYGQVIAAGGEGIVITREDCHYLCGKRTAWMTLKMKKELEDTIDAFVDGDYKTPTRLYNGNEMETWSYWENTKTGEKFNTCQFGLFCAGHPVEPVTKPYYHGWASAISFSVMDGDKPRHIAWISNIPDEIKEGIIKNPDKWVGKVAELTAMEIEHIDNDYTLRHGKIDKWRDDKKSTDCEYGQLIK